MRIISRLFVIAACALGLAACGSGSSTSSQSSAPTSATSSTSTAASGTASSSSTTSATTSSGPAIGFEGVPLEQGPDLASPSTTGTATEDGISCAPVEQLAYHIHAHLAVFDAGRLYALPPGIGIPGSSVVQTNQGPEASQGQCIYWLHTHTNDGVIHIESPTNTIYTLGDFFDIWRQPLSPTRIAGLHGAVTAFVNGKPWKKSPRAIPLMSHQVIQLEIGAPAPPLVTVDWSQTAL